MFDIAIVIATAGRASLVRAVESIYAQDFVGSIQVLVGVDVDTSGKSRELHQALLGRCPARMAMTWIDLGYSTSRRHGGVHSCHFGGSLRSALTMCAQSEIVAYLDDDDWYDAAHVRAITAAIRGRKWAYSLCWYADSNSGRALCVDEIESVGPDKGVFGPKFGGFVRPSALAINKLALSHLVHLWSHSPYPTGDGEDRLVFDRLRRELDFGATGIPTVCYAVDPKDGMHGLRRRFMMSKGVELPDTAKDGSLR